MVDDQSQLSFEISSTAEDYTAFLLYMTRRPRRLAAHAGTFVLIGLALVLLQLAIGLLGVAFAARGSVESAMRDYLSNGFGGELVAVMPWGIAFLVLLFGLNVFVLVPRQCRSIAAGIIASYPSRSIENQRPVLVSRLTLDDRGVESSMTDERVFVAWQLVRDLIETKRHIFLITSKENAFVVPKSEVGTSTTRRLVEMVSQRGVGSDR